MVILVRAALAGGGWLGVCLKIGVNVFDDDEPAPHEFPVAGGMNRNIRSRLPGWGAVNFKVSCWPFSRSLVPPRIVGGFGDVGAALAVDLIGHHFGREIGDLLAGVGFDDEQVVGHIVGVFEDDFKRFCRPRRRGAGCRSASGSRTVVDDEDIDAELF